MNLIMIVNRESPEGLSGVMQAITQLALGLGHSISGILNINIFIGNTLQMNEFRRYERALHDSGSIVIPRAPITHTAGPIYGSAYFILSSEDTLDPEFSEFLASLDRFRSYRPRRGERFVTGFPLQEIVPLPDPEERTACLVIDRWMHLSHFFNECIMAGLRCSAEHFALLNLRQGDDDGRPLPCVPSIPLRILVSGKMDDLAHKIANNIYFSSTTAAENKTILTMFNGPSHLLDVILNGLADPFPAELPFQRRLITKNKRSSGCTFFSVSNRGKGDFLSAGELADVDEKESTNLRELKRGPR